MQPQKDFLAFRFFYQIGALVWAITVGTAGYLFGRAFVMVLGEIKSIEKWVLAGILAIGVLVWLIHFRKMRRLRSTVDQPTVSDRKYDHGEVACCQS